MPLAISCSCTYSPVCVRPGRTHGRQVFSRPGSIHLSYENEIFSCLKRERKKSDLPTRTNNPRATMATFIVIGLCLQLQLICQTTYGRAVYIASCHPVWSWTFRTPHSPVIRNASILNSCIACATCPQIWRLVGLFVMYNMFSNSECSCETVQMLMHTRTFAACIIEPRHEKNNSGFRPGPTQPKLYSYRRWLEAWSFGFRKYRDRAIYVAKTKALISFAVGYREADLRLCFCICKTPIFS